MHIVYGAKSIPNRKNIKDKKTKSAHKLTRTKEVITQLIEKEAYEACLLASQDIENKTNMTQCIESSIRASIISCNHDSY